MQMITDENRGSMLEHATGKGRKTFRQVAPNAWLVVAIDQG